jgi:hypothetical protein
MISAVKRSSNSFRQSFREIEPMSRTASTRLSTSVCQNTADTGPDYLGDGAARPRDHGGAARQGLDDRQTEGLGPIDSEQQREGVAEKLGFFVLSNLSDVFDQRRPDTGLGHLIEIFTIDRIHFGRDPKRQTGAGRDFNRDVEPFLRRDPPNESEILPRTRPLRSPRTQMSMPSA